MNYEEVKKYLKRYSSGIPPYDPVGAMYLLKAIIENLQRNFIDEDFEEYAACLSEEDEALLKRLIENIPRSRLFEQQDEEKD